MRQTQVVSVRELRELLDRQSADLKIEVSAEGLQRLRHGVVNPTEYVSEADQDRIDWAILKKRKSAKVHSLRDVKKRYGIR